MNKPVPKRRIAFYTSSDCFGGLEKNVLHFMEWLGNEKNEVILLSDEKNIISKAAAQRKIPLMFIEKTGNYASLRKAIQLGRILHVNTIEVLFIIRPRDILLAAITRFFFYRQLRLIYFQQSKLNLKKHPLLYSILFRPYSAWIIPTAHLHDEALKMARYKPSQLHVIPPCIDTEYYEKDTLTRKAARKILELPEGRIIMGIIGRYDQKCRQDFLIRTLQLLHRNHYDVDLLIMGKTGDEEQTEYYRFLKILVQECQVEKYVYFRSYSDKILTFLRALDYFIMNWAGEPYDLILLKAMASGVPVIARFSGLNTELLENGKYGLLYRPGDIEDLSGKIIQLLTQNRLADHLRSESKKYVEENFDKKIGCRIMEELLEKLDYKS